MGAYSNKEKKFMTKTILDLLDDPDVSMTTVPRKEGYPELAVLKQEVFTDLVTELEQIKKWAWLACQGIVLLDVASPDLGENIRGLILMAADAGPRFFGMDDPQKVAKDNELISYTGEKNG